MGHVVTEGSLGTILYNSRIITEADIEKALAEQGRAGCRFGEALVRLGIVTAEDISWALSHRLDIPYIRLNREVMGPEAAGLLPERVARRYRAVPVIRTGDELRVALVDPLDPEALREIEAVSSGAVTIAIADESDVAAMLDFLYGPEQKGEFGLLSSVAPAEESSAMIADPTGGCFLEWLLTQLARGGYRSVTLAPLADGGVITGHLGAVTREVGRLTPDACARFVARLRRRAELRSTGGAAEQGTLEYRDGERAHAVHVHLLKGTDGEVVTLTMPEFTAAAPFPAELAPHLRDMTGRPGLLLLSLPIEETRRVMELLLDGHAAGGQRALLLGEGNESLRRMVPSVPLGTPTPPDSAELVREALEHGPEILLLEEAGTVPCLIAAARAALCGTRVVAGTGAGMAETFALLSSAWRRHHLVSSALRGIVAGVAVPILCASCRETLPLTGEEIDRLRLPPAETGYHHARGCAACGYTGRGGARLLVEVITCDRMLADILDTRWTGEDVVAALAGRGVGTIRAQATRLLASGEISPETYLRAVTA